MKSILISIAASVMFVMLLVGTPSSASAQNVEVSFQMFYDELGPYGQWVDHPNYGYIWLPNAENDFEPYSTDGHWIYTNYGWTWVSYYPWGWAPFHYGRWGYDNYYGWFWVPGTDWGPSWVLWRQADGYFGWQPLGPGISISLSFGSGYSKSYDHWKFVRYSDIEREHINQFYIPQSDRNRIISRSRIIKETYSDNNRHTTYITGPSRDEVKRYTGRDIRPVAVHEYSKPGQEVRQGEIHFYRPVVRQNAENESRPMPARVIKSTEVKRSSDRNTTTFPRNVNQSNPTRRNEPQQNISRPYDNRTNKPQPVARPNRKYDNSQPNRVPESAPGKEVRKPTQSTNPVLQRTPQERTLRPQSKSTVKPIQQPTQQPKRVEKTKEERKKSHTTKVTNKRDEPKKESDADKRDERRK